MKNACIKIENLFIRFGKYTSLENINLEIKANTFVSIVGPNGGGKTTLLKVILGLIKPSEGNVQINGMNTLEIPPEIIGYVPQIKTSDMTFPALPIELVASGIRGNWVARLSNDEKKSAIGALERVGAGHLAKRQLSKLSGGELQRIYLARSFVRKPLILLLDEPVTGIDLMGESDIHKIIEDYKNESNAIIILVTHDWESAYHHADKVLLLNKSQICFDEPSIAFSEAYLRKAFSHVGHKHEMIFGVKNNA